MSSAPAPIAPLRRFAKLLGGELADRAIHIESEETATDPLALARTMASALESEKPDLILTGLQSDDLGYGQTGVILAEVAGLSACHSRHEYRNNRGRHSRQTRTRRRLVPERGNAASGTADYSVRRSQTSLCHSHGHQESEIEERVKKAIAAQPGTTSSLKPERIYLPQKSEAILQLYEGTPQEARRAAGGQIPLSKRGILIERNSRGPRAA